MKTEMKLSAKGCEFLALQEGFRTEAYRDPAGLLSIGVGHLLTQQERVTGRIEINGESIRYGGKGLTKKQVMDLLGQDVGRFEAVVNKHVKVELRQNEFDALVSLAFNIGACAFKESTLVKKLNVGEMLAVPTEILRWDKSGGKRLRGLTRRREAEARLFSEGYMGEGRADEVPTSPKSEVA